MIQAPTEPRTRAEALRHAESIAAALFQEITAENLVRPGTTEQALNDAAHALARDRFGIKQHWHKRIVRAGPNTLCPYAENPPNRTIQADDIVFFDFGPVLGAWEADYGRTFVLGSDPDKHRIAADVEACWTLAKTHLDAHPTITGAELYAFVRQLAIERGWTYGQEHCDHLIGAFPHERIQGEEVRNYIHPDNHDPLRALDQNGVRRDWILEIHFVHRDQGIGAFFEQWMTTPP